MLKIRYDSEEGRRFAARISESMRDAAYDASVDLAIEKGAFPLFDADKYLAEPHCASRLPDSIKARIRKHGIRNSHLLSIAPPAPFRWPLPITPAMASSRRSPGSTPAKSAWPMARPRNTWWKTMPIACTACRVAIPRHCRTTLSRHWK
jgi:hypothetical protein